MRKFYFTFGSDLKYPFGINDYVLVEAEDCTQAAQLFQVLHPNRPNSHCINCAFIYPEKQFLPMIDEYYGGNPPIETISVKRRSKE